MTKFLSSGWKFWSVLPPTTTFAAFEFSGSLAPTEYDTGSPIFALPPAARRPSQSEPCAAKSSCRKTENCEAAPRKYSFESLIPRSISLF